MQMNKNFSNVNIILMTNETFISLLVTFIYIYINGKISETKRKSISSILLLRKKAKLQKRNLRKFSYQVFLYFQNTVNVYRNYIISPKQ